MTASSVPTDKVFCGVSGPIYWSKNDTDKTILAIKERNAVWKALCVAKAAKPKPQGVSFKDRWHEGVKTYATVFR